MKAGRFAALHTMSVRPAGKCPAYPGGHQPDTAAGGVMEYLLAPGDCRPVKQRHTAPRPARLAAALRSPARSTHIVRAAAVTRALFTVVLIWAAMTAVAAGASAQPAADPHQFSDRTAEFIPLGAPNALAARDSGKQLVLSPHGTRRSIVCRGNGSTVPLYDCSQEDGLGWAPLHRKDTPVGEVWIYFP